MGQTAGSVPEGAVARKLAKQCDLERTMRAARDRQDAQPDKLPALRLARRRATPAGSHHASGIVQARNLLLPPTAPRRFCWSKRAAPPRLGSKATATRKTLWRASVCWPMLWGLAVCASGAIGTAAIQLFEDQVAAPRTAGLENSSAKPSSSTVAHSPTFTAIPIIDVGGHGSARSTRRHSHTSRSNTPN